MSLAALGAVDTVPVVALTLRKVAFFGVVAPIVMLSIVPALVGFICIEPAPLGLMWT
jgi:hypothetical protein